MAAGQLPPSVLHSAVLGQTPSVIVLTN